MSVIRFQIRIIGFTELCWSLKAWRSLWDSRMKVQYMRTRLKKNRAKLNRMHSAERDQWRNVIESDATRCCEAADIVSYPGGVHKLLPVSLSDGRVLQLVDGSQRGQQVLHSRLQTHVDVPHPHLLIQHLHLLQCVRYSC